MKNEIIKLISDLKEEINPILKADEISHFIIEALRQNKISLYESYVLNWEVVKFIQLGYLQPGWGGSVRITTCIFFS